MQLIAQQPQQVLMGLPTWQLNRQIFVPTLVPLGLQLIPQNAISVTNFVMPNQTLQQTFQIGTPALTPASHFKLDYTHLKLT